MSIRRRLGLASWLGAVASLLLVATSSWALDLAVGTRVDLQATNPLGVPLHRQPHPSLFGRVADGTIGTIIGLRDENRWLNVTLPDNRVGWVLGGYVRRVLPPATPPVDPRLDSANDVSEVWTSAERCEIVVRAGRRMQGARPNPLRVATWSIRWFPDGDPTPGPTSPPPTDLRWLACTLAWMNADLVALQEIRTTPQAMDAWESVLNGLVALTGEGWRVDFKGCGAPGDPYVGFLWNTSRLTLSDLTDVWQLNGASTGPRQPCAGNLRPGYHAHVRTVAPGGPSFHAVTVHLDPGRADADLNRRRTSLARIGEAVAPMRATDADVIVLGDFNTIGTDAGVTAAQEIAEMTTTVAAAQFDRLPVSHGCTGYSSQEGEWRDHVLVATTMAEVSLRSATVTGYCALAGCARLTDPMPAAYQRLSGHCPVVVEVDNVTTGD